MEATRADIEQAAASLATRSQLVEMLVHGAHDWAVGIGGVMHRPSLDVDLDDITLVVSFYIHAPEADGDHFEIYADGDLMHAVPGRITKGKPAWLRLRFAGAPAPASV